MKRNKTPGAVALEDGRIFEGHSFGARGIATGEAVFNTGMTGYQEILTDPSYKGQIVTLTHPLTGNYGVNARDAESSGPQAEGFITREYCPYPSCNEAEGDLAGYLRESGVIAISGVDTRALTRHIRRAGAMRAAIAAGDYDADKLVRLAATAPSLSELDLVSRVTCESIHDFPFDRHGGQNGPLVVVYDYGAKRTILNSLADAGCCVSVVPASTPAKTVLEMQPDGVLLSNGPGDPAVLSCAVDEIRKLIGRIPIFGICLGHQLLALALGGTTYKLPFGHHGSNHPVRDMETGRIDITCQNHGFCVDIESLPDDEVRITHLNMNDRTLEGFHHIELPLMSVQHHPESGPGPHDARHLFTEFKSLMAEHNR